MPLLRDLRDQLGSSYLLDHVDNPVLWRTWGEDALEEARRRDVPIFLSVGYAACHWCHVMAHESFEDRDIAVELNDHFVPIKVDREERPDVDALYMAATQLASGHGGWPMSVFLLPDGRAFMAGTYYPPVDRGGQIGFGRLLRSLHEAWTTQRDAIERQATAMTESLTKEVRFVDHLAPSRDALNLHAVRQELREELLERADLDGGFGAAPKFPRPSYVDALVDFDDETANRAVERTLDSMSRRGLYDHFGGGFARYSVDGEWHVPHFEKMLSDQALLARCYLRASRVRHRDDWRDVALDAMDFVVRELRRDDGYASSLDADAGGVEGSHITWTSREIDDGLVASGLSTHLAAVLARWRIESPGAFEGRSIPRLANDEPFRTPTSLRAAHEALMEVRRGRVQPGRDEKVILEWNAMMASSFLRSDSPRFETLGLELLSSLARTHRHQEKWWRTERREAHATACDVAWLLDAVLDAFELTGSDQWLDQSLELSSYLLAHYWDGEMPTVTTPDRGGGVFSQSDFVTDLPLRPKEIFDGATPSAHAITTRALARAALARGDAELLVVAQRLVELAGSLLTHHPSAVPDLVEAAGYALDGVEIVIPGAPNRLSQHVRSLPMARTILVTGSGSSPLLEGRREGLAYVCRGGVCALPSKDVNELDAQLRSVRTS